MNEPSPLGPDIEAVLNRILPEHLAQGRVELLREHATRVLDLRDVHRMMWQRLLFGEMRHLLLDGFPPALAGVAARNNLAVRKQELDAELAECLEREKGALLGRMRRLVEKAE